MSVQVDDVFMACKPYTLDNIKELINLKYNIKEFSK